MKKIFGLYLILIGNISFGQSWIDTTFSISTEMNITYGVSTSFAGQEDTLKLDISYPENDTPPECGRPLMVIVHGGSWLIGDKNEGYPRALRQDFAKRGYVTASVNYRLGQFQTDRPINCNVPDWNCFNMTDSSEWYRANHRGIQDVHGAIRFLINEASPYQIDPNNVFLVGESAGAFVAMGVGFIDDPSEVLNHLIGSHDDAPAPNTLYETPCIQNLELADDISSMNLSRPALGDYEGTLNRPSNQAFNIRAVGNLYGGAFNNIFEAFGESPPALYLYHQPCDLIVPFGYTRILSGYNNCLAPFPTSCGNIINRPFTYGSRSIKELIDTMTANSIPTSAYYYDISGNTYNCIQQLDPNLACHAIDNYRLRTTNMATYFAGFVGACIIDAVNNENTDKKSIVQTLHPNPVHDVLKIQFNKTIHNINIKMITLLGENILESRYSDVQHVELEVGHLPVGFYHLLFEYDQNREVRSFVKN